jgi:biopolymer transport protein ExbD
MARSSKKQPATGKRKPPDIGDWGATGSASASTNTKSKPYAVGSRTPFQEISMPLKTNRDEQPTINLTPMIDIVFLLIIFFMVGTKFSELTEAEKHIDLSVPSVAEATALTSAPKNRVISVFRDGRIQLDQQQVTLAQLKTELQRAKTQYAKIGVVVRGDATSYYQNVADVLATCQSVEIVDLQVAVRVAKKPK